MSSGRPYQPAPELRRVLDDLDRLGNPLDQMTRDNVAALWLLRESLAGTVLGPLPVAGAQTGRRGGAGPVGGLLGG